MEINNNLELLNICFAKMRLNKREKIEFIKIAKLSKSLDDLKENCEWDYQTMNIK
tara:strand:- start:5813 stop:5977 length:165 start_codon:yes stop_codon:yes gene_type:complete